MRFTFLLTAWLHVISACAGTDSAPDVFVDAATDDSFDALDDPSATDLAEGLDTTASGPCTVLFGLPNEKTGLTAEQCQPRCSCDGRTFEPPAYTEAQIAALEARVLVNPFAPPDADPYANPAAHVPVEGAVCGVLPEPSVAGGYRLATYASRAAALEDGAIPSHEGACGLCSPLVDLAVYLRHPDLTEPVRACGLKGISEGEEAQMQCLREVGFDLPCARIWYYNTRATQKACGGVCLAALNQPYHAPDGALNACLQCDEEKSGPVFKAVAGRNRRNTGLPSSMCRPCAEVQPFVHLYP